MDKTVVLVISELGASAWCLWQPAWNVMNVRGFGEDEGISEPQAFKQYFALGQFCCHIKPGARFFEVSAKDWLAVLNEDRSLVVVSLNRGADAGERFSRIVPSRIRTS